MIFNLTLIETLNSNQILRRYKTIILKQMIIIHLNTTFNQNNSNIRSLFLYVYTYTFENIQQKLIL